MARAPLGTFAVTAALALGCVDGSGTSDGGSGMPAGFECLGHVPSPDAPAASLETSLRFYQINPEWNPLSNPDVQYRLPLEGLKVEVCESRSDCSTPYATVVTNPYGDASLTLPTPGKGFSGSLRLSAAGFITEVVTVDPPIVDASNPWLSNTFHTHASFTTDTFRARWGATYDPSRTSILANVADCDGNHNAAVRVTVDGGEASRNEAPVFAFTNIPPGTHEIVATVAGTGEEIARVTVVAAAGEMVGVHLGPMPSTP